MRKGAMLTALIIIFIFIINFSFITASDIIVRAGDFIVDTNTFFVNATSNRVGIGTTSPAGKLEILRTNAGIAVNVSHSGAAYSTNYGILSNVIGLTSSTDYAGHFRVSGSGGGIHYGIYTSANDTPSGGTVYGIYATASGATTNYAGYFANADVYVEKNVSAQGFIDRSRWCDMSGSNALNALRNIKGNVNINHTSMPACTRVNISRFDPGTNQTIAEDGRDIGAYISYLTIVNQELLNKIETLETELCAKDNTYPFC